MPSYYEAEDLVWRSALGIRTRRLRLSVIRLLKTRQPELCGSARLLIQSHVPSAIELLHRACGPAETERSRDSSKDRHRQVAVLWHCDNDRLPHLGDLFEPGGWRDYSR